MGIVTKHIVIGFFIALFATFGGFFIYLEYFSKYEFYETLEFIKEGDLFGKVITLAAIPNLFVFFIFLKKRQDYKARGVLLATIVLALFTLILKFF